jgi:hypothetical protein
MPAPDTVAMAEPAVTPAPQSAQQSELSVPDEALPIAGAGLGALALAGLGMAVRRRRRDDEEEEELWLEEQPVEDQFREPAAPARPDPAYVEPIAAVPPIAAATAPVLAPAKTTANDDDLPEGFDLSKYGRHVQAAYRGPTDNNPSLSLKKRLKVARAMDQRERLQGIADQASAIVTPTAEPKAPAMPKPGTDRPVMSQFKPVKVAFGQPKDEPVFHY